MAESKLTKRTRYFKDLTGQKFGRLSVIAIDGKRDSNFCWRCMCDCGAVITVRSGSLVYGTTQSCGCLQRDRARASAIERAKTRKRIIPRKEYEAWRSAKDRCINPECAAYPHYGARGITMCPEWMNDPVAFYRDMGPSAPGLSLDRINNDGNYEPSNCRWADKTTQSRNQRGSISITHEGTTLPIKEWAIRAGMEYKTLLRRYREGRPLFAPVRKYSR